MFVTQYKYIYHGTVRCGCAVKCFLYCNNKTEASIFHLLDPILEHIEMELESDM